MSPRSTSHRLAIDWTLCDGHGLCARMWPERIGTDEWGFPLFDGRSIGEADLSDARRAVAACPRLALRLQRG